MMFGVCLVSCCRPIVADLIHVYGTANASRVSADDRGMNIYDASPQLGFHPMDVFIGGYTNTGMTKARFW